MCFNGCLAGLQNLTRAHGERQAVLTRWARRGSELQPRGQPSSPAAHADGAQAHLNIMCCMLHLAHAASSRTAGGAGTPAEAAVAEAQSRAGVPVAIRRLAELASSGTLGSPSSSSELPAAIHGAALTAGAPTAAYIVLVLPARQPVCAPCLMPLRRISFASLQMLFT